MRTVKHEWGVNVIDVVNKCTYWCICRARNGHSRQQNTLCLTPSTAREARSERPRQATTLSSISSVVSLQCVCVCVCVTYCRRLSTNEAISFTAAAATDSQARSQDCQNEEADRSSAPSPPLPSCPFPFPSLPSP